MRAAVRERYGPPEVVEVRQIERPLPKDREVLVRVKAASVNRADLDNLYPRWKFMRLFLGLRRPRERRVGLDLAGVVEAVGTGVEGLRQGDEVFGDMFEFGQGAFAEYVCAPAKAFAPKPAGMTFEEAATLPHSAVLALQGLRLRNGRTPQPGQRVLIAGASGNVGPFAVQIAKSFGAEVTGVCSTAKVDFVRSLGADHVIDYSEADYIRSGERYDWILDVDARYAIPRWRRLLRPNGVYLALGGSGSWFLAALLLAPALALLRGKTSGLMLWWKPFHRPDVDKLKELIGAGKLRPAIDRRYPLSDVVEALRRVDEGRAAGKIVVSVED